MILRKHPSGWWDGCSTKSAQRGWLPSNHVEVVDAHSIVLDKAMRATVGEIEGGRGDARGTPSTRFRQGLAPSCLRLRRNLGPLPCASIWGSF